MNDKSLTDADAEVYILGGGAVGTALAQRLRESNLDVNLIDVGADPGAVPSRRVDPTYSNALAEVELPSAATVIVATPGGGRNLLFAQLVRVRFDVERVLVVANNPDRVDMLADAGHDSICASTALADAVADHL
jgi:Trk K+ transport system NAD-binding subunit